MSRRVAPAGRSAVTYPILAATAKTSNRCRTASRAVGDVDQRPPVVDDGVHHRVPVTAQIGRRLRDGAAVITDLERRPTTRPIRDRGPLIRDAIVDLHERHDRAPRARESRPLPRPHQSRLRPKHGRSTSSTSIRSCCHTCPSLPGTRRPLGPTSSPDTERARCRFRHFRSVPSRLVTDRRARRPRLV